MLSKRILITALAACLFTVISLIGYRQFQDLRRTQKATQEDSKMVELRTALATELENYYQKHREYPHLLKDLPLNNFDWGKEGATIKDLDLFSYVSDGQTFVMQWHGDRNLSVYLAGKNGRSIFSEGETNKFQIIPVNGR